MQSFTFGDVVKDRFTPGDGQLWHEVSYDGGETWSEMVGHAMPGPFTSESHLERAHKGYYFSADTMRFFRGRVLALVGGRLLVDSISGPWGEGPRSYRVSLWDDNGDQVARLREFSTAKAAHAFAHKVAGACLVKVPA